MYFLLVIDAHTEVSVWFVYQVQKEADYTNWFYPDHSKQRKHTHLLMLFKKGVGAFSFWFYCVAIYLSIHHLITFLHCFIHLWWSSVPLMLDRCCISWHWLTGNETSELVNTLSVASVVSWCLLDELQPRTFCFESLILMLLWYWDVHFMNRSTGGVGGGNHSCFH